MRHRPLYLLAGWALYCSPWLFLGCGDDEETGGDDSPAGGRTDQGGSGGSQDATGGRKSDGGSPSGGNGQGGEGDAGAGGDAGASSGGASAAGSDPGGAGGEPSGPWMGVRCEEPASGAVTPYFEVPGADDAKLGDFFRLPFPNDIRRTADGLDLTGYPRPGVGLLGVDPVALYVEAIEANDRAWGSDPTTFFRFSGALDPDSLEAGVSVRYVDITGSAATFGDESELSLFYTSDRTRYVCDNWLGVRRPLGAPLLSGHTYAVLVTTDVVAAGGSPLEPSSQFASVIGDDAPSDAALAVAHAAYQPLRAYLADRGIAPDAIATAAVFTVGDLSRAMTELAEAVESVAAPTVSGDWVLCRDGVESPCPQRDGGRACGAQVTAYDEYHAIVTLPSYQRGQPPFSKAADGGGIDVSQDPEWIDVCMALTVPTGPVPAAGFPLVISAHGTGGSFRSHVTATNAGALASGSVQFAVLGIDQVSHGTRRGTSMTLPETLFFNFMNPAAARGNPLQGAVDQLSLARFAETLDGTGGQPVRIDPTRIVFFGHSQGSTEGSLAIPFGDRFRAAVLSGNGGSLQRALLTKTKPVNLRGTLPVILNDVPFDDMAFPAEYHPVLSLVQQWIDPADPMNFARHAALDPLPGHEPRHTFQTYGLEDTYSPASTLSAFVLAGGFTHVAPELEPLGLDVVPPPLAGNLDGVTLGFRQYSPPDGEDGHHVAFSVSEANADVVRFLSMAVSDQTPEIGP
jgi:hypothetical protein